MIERYSDEMLEKAAAAIRRLPNATHLNSRQAARAALDAVAGDLGARSLEETADVLARPRVLWFGDGGVTVLHEGKYATLEQYQAERPTLVQWLRDQAVRWREGIG